MNHKLIHSIDELKYFFDNILPDLQRDEVFFVSLSARNKYLTPDERETLGLGRTEMFERTIIREKEWRRFLKRIRRFETPDEAYLTKNNNPIPNKCIVVYFNINPSSSIKALHEFRSKTDEYFLEMIQSNNIQDGFKKMNKVDVLLMNCFQRSRGHKSYIDIDFDIPKSEFHIVQFFLKHMKNNSPNKIKYWIIDTKSGYHVMLDRSTLKYNFNESISAAEEYVFNMTEIENFEIINNKNEMIPLPGTYQAGYPVTIIKEVEKYVN